MPSGKQIENQIVSSGNFTFAIDGDYDVDASLLGISISNLAYIVEELSESDVVKPECRLKVTGFQKGSFEVLLAVVLVTAGQLSSLYTLDEAALLIASIKGIFDIKKLLKGNRPEKIETDQKSGYARVVSPDGTDVTAPLGSTIVINNPKVERKVNEMSKALLYSNPEGGFRITSGDQSSCYNHEDVEDIALPIHVTESEPSDLVENSRVTLPVKKLDLSGLSAWTFSYGSRNIQAKIEDGGFLRQVHQGSDAFSAGDKLDVALVKITKISPDGVPLREKYSVEHVYRHIPTPRSEQIKY